MLNGLLRSDGAMSIYLACGNTDMRKSIDGLAAIVQHSFQLDPTQGSLFIFCNRGGDKLKILYWEHNGFWLFYRRLERGRFRWPRSRPGEPVAIDSRQLQWLLDGLDFERCPARAHPRITATVMA